MRLRHVAVLQRSWAGNGGSVGFIEDRFLEHEHTVYRLEQVCGSHRWCSFQLREIDSDSQGDNHESFVCAGCYRVSAMIQGLGLLVESWDYEVGKTLVYIP